MWTPQYLDRGLDDRRASASAAETRGLRPWGLGACTHSLFHSFIPSLLHSLTVATTTANFGMCVCVWVCMPRWTHYSSTRSGRLRLDQLWTERWRSKSHVSFLPSVVARARIHQASIAHRGRTPSRAALLHLDRSAVNHVSSRLDNTSSSARRRGASSICARTHAHTHT